MFWSQLRDNKLESLLLLVLISCTIILFLNDRVWKYEYSNWVTGKLSDFVGLLAVPIFVALIYPASKKVVAPIVGLLFLFWKHPYADSIHSFWNSLGLFEIQRVVDYSDYLAISMLVVAHVLLKKCDVKALKEFVASYTSKAFRVLSFVVFSLVFCSTSMMEPAYPKGDILIDETFGIDGVSEIEAISRIEGMGLSVSKDSILYLSNSRTLISPYYQIEKFVFDRGDVLDTLSGINFTVSASKSGVNIHVINCSVNNDWDLQNWKTLKARTGVYKKVLKEHLMKDVAEAEVGN